MSKMKIKVINVTNRDNVLVQIPKWVCDLWDLETGDKLDMNMIVDEVTKAVTITKHIEGDVE